MKLPGQGVLTGMMITLKHAVDTYVTDIGPRIKKGKLFKLVDQEMTMERQTVKEKGLFTVQYPDIKLKPQEAFRFLPFLLYEPAVDAQGKAILDAATGLPRVGEELCTACGICTKVCPPQCIWIVRAVSEEGKPKPKAAEFYVDIDVCMNCGYCAEFCPFDAIKMDSEYELAGYERHMNHVLDINALMKPTTYYASIKPTFFQEEEAARKAKEEKKK